MLYRECIVDTMVSTLISANTMAGLSVYADRDWPVTEPDLPCIRIKSPSERKESLVRGIPQFTTTATVNILASVSGVNSAAVAQSLATIGDQIEQAILSAGSPVQWMVQQFVSVDTETRTSSEGGKPLGDILLSIGCEFYQEYIPDPDSGVSMPQIDFQISQPAGDAPTILGGVNALTGGVPTIEP